MPHGAEPAHKPKPPEHVKPIEDPSHQRRLNTLAGDFHTRAQVAFDHVVSSGTGATGPAREVQLEHIRQLRDKAGEYSLGLYGYWKYARERFSDSYIYRQEGKLAELNELLGPLKDTDVRLEKQLKDWAEATSPYGDTYDVERIEAVGRDLSETLNIASVYLTNRIRELSRGGLNLDEKGKRDSSVSGAMLLSISGLAEQIGSRMGDLGSGKTVPDVTMSNTTIEIMNRAGQDDSKFTLETRFETATDTHDGLEKLKADYVNSKYKEHLRIEADIVELRNNHRDDPDFPERLKELQEKLAEVGIASFFDALEEHTGRGGDEKLKSDALEFNSLNRQIANPRLEPGDVAALLEKRKILLETMLPKLRTLMEATVQENSERLEKYENNLRDSTDNFDDDPYKFWSKSKKKVLKQIEDLAGEETRKKLDDAFSSGNLSGKVEKWIEILDHGKPDPATMQSRASEVVTTAEKYLERIEGLLKDADIDDALRVLKDQLVSALTAIKLSTANHLTDQFKRGRFKN